MPLRIVQRHHAARIRSDHCSHNRRRRAQPLDNDAQMMFDANAATIHLMSVYHYRE